MDGKPFIRYGGSTSMDETTEQEQEKKEECLHKHENGKHEGPYHRYMWNVRVSRYRNYPNRSEEHTSELQSHSDLVCRLLLEKKKKKKKKVNNTVKKETMEKRIKQ